MRRWRREALGLLVLWLRASSAGAQEAGGVEQRGEEALFEVEEEGVDAPREAEQGAVEAKQGQEESLGRMSLKELEAAGFEFENQRARRLRPTALLYTVTIGTLLHGAGHLYLEQWEVGWSLAAMEGVGLGFFIAGLTLPTLVQSDEVVGAVARPLTYAGVGLFSASFLLDLVGILRSEDIPIYDTQEVRPSVWADAHYGFLSTDTFPVSQVLDVRAMVDLSALYVGLGTQQSIVLDTSRYEVSVGWRPWQEKGTEGQVFLEAEADLLQYRGLGRFSRLQAVGWAGGGLDMGRLARSLRLISFGLKVGYAYQWYAYPTARPPELDQESDAVSPLDISAGLSTVPVEVSGGLSLTEKLYMKLYYTRHDGEYLQDIDTRWAVPSVALRYSVSPKTDLSIKGAYGEGFMVWGGFRLWGWK